MINYSKLKLGRIILKSFASKIAESVVQNLASKWIFSGDKRGCQINVLPPSVERTFCLRVPQSDV